jgi:hypothetical protein
MNAKKKFLKYMAAFVVAVWVLGVSVLFSLLTAQHVLTMPVPKNQKFLQAALAQVGEKKTGWRGFHVLLSQCLCSQDVARYLVARKKSPLFDEETVLLIAEKNPKIEQDLKASGFGVVSVAFKDVVAQYGVEGAPSFHVLNPQGKLLYTGGYYEQRARTEALDLKIVQNLQLNRSMAPLPLYGCALGMSLQKNLDPLNLKYTTQEK